MKARCYNPKNISYPRYGGRGIKVCDSWRESFETFLVDLSPWPGSGYTLDRINPDGDYEPSNVRWATPAQQQHNRRDAKFTLDSIGEIGSLVAAGIQQSQIAATFGVHQSTISRIVNGKRWKER